MKPQCKLCGYKAIALTWYEMMVLHMKLRHNIEGKFDDLIEVIHEQGD